MPREFESTNVLDAAMQKVKGLAEDVVFGSVIAMTEYSECHNVPRDAERLIEVAAALAPELELVREDALLDRIERLDQDLKEDTLAHLGSTRDAFFHVGLLVGASLSDPSGRSFDQLRRAWIREMLAKPRYQHLQQSTAQDGDGSIHRHAQPSEV